MDDAPLKHPSEAESLVSINLASKHDPLRTQGIPAATFNLINAVLGSGVLAFPYAFSKTGLGMGVLFTMLLVVVAVFGLKILGEVAARINAVSYQDVVEHSLGKQWKIIVEILLVIYFLGACVVFLNVIGDTVGSALVYYFGKGHPYTSRTFVVGIGALLCLPLTFIRKMRYLSPVSFVTLLSVLYTVVVVILYGAEKVGSPGGAPVPHIFLNPSTNFFFAFPIISFAFQCHVSSVPIMRELKTPSGRRQNWVFGVSMCVCVGLYIMCGAFGYLLYPDPDGDILKCFSFVVPQQIARFAIGLTAIGSFPIMSFNARLALETLTRYVTPKKWNLLVFVVVMVCWSGLALLISIFVTQISTIFKFIGAVGASTFAFALPGLIVATDRSKPMEHRVTGVILTVFSIVAAGISVVVTIIGIVETGQASAQCTINSTLAQNTTVLYDFL